MALLEINDLCASYGALRILHGLSLTVNDGECLALLGPSGCGKSTTLRAVAGFVQPTGGTIRIGGRDVGGLPPHLRNVGLVFQDYALFPHMTVGDNVAYGLKRRGVPRSDIGPMVREALRMVRLDQHMERYPNAMSGGQRQRVALARALVTRPDVLLLDEPLGALDRKLRDEMQYELKTLQAKLGFTCIIVTHDQEEALSLAGRVALMLDGEIAELATPSKLYGSPGSVRAMEFLGASSIFPAKVVSRSVAVSYELPGGVRVLGPDIGLIEGSAATLGVRPEFVRITNAEPEVDNAMPMSVRQVVYKGPSTDVYLEGRIGSLRAQVDLAATSAEVGFVPGQSVWVAIDRENFRVFPPAADVPPSQMVNP